MLILGHIGIGTWICTPLRGRRYPLPWRPLVVGTLLPDLIDKPLFYGLEAVLGRDHVWVAQVIAGTRSLGHTALGLLALLALAYFRRSRLLSALALGVATHLLLDQLAETLALAISPGTLLPEASRFRVALLYPLEGWRFPQAIAPSLDAHLRSLATPLQLGGEALGLALILWQWSSRSLWRKAKTGRSASVRDSL